MVICHVLSSFGMGGQERLAVELGRGQVARGHRVFAVSLAPPPEGPEAERFRAAGVRTHTLPKAERGFDAGLVVRLARLLAAERAGVVHTHNPQPLIYGAPAALVSGARLVHTKHGANPDRLRRRMLRKLCGHLADAYVAVSPETADVAARQGECIQGRLAVIANGVDVDHFRHDSEARRSARLELGIPETSWLVGTVGRLAAEKDHRLLLDAVEPLLGEDFRLVIVGDGPERESTARRAAELEGARFVHLTGARNDVARLLSALDVFVLSSRTEGLPLVLPEAMAARLPVVSTSVGGIPSVIEHARTGLLVPPGDAQALRDALAELAREPARAREMGALGEQVARERFSRDTMVDRYMELYGETSR